MRFEQCSFKSVDSLARAPDLPSVFRSTGFFSDLTWSDCHCCPLFFLSFRVNCDKRSCKWNVSVWSMSTGGVWMKEWLMFADRNCCLFKGFKGWLKGTATDFALFTQMFFLIVEVNLLPGFQWTNSRSTVPILLFRVSWVQLCQTRVNQAQASSTKVCGAYTNNVNRSAREPGQKPACHMRYNISKHHTTVAFFFPLVFAICS